MHVVMAVLSAHTTRRLFELGALLGFLGGIVLAFVPRFGRRAAGLLLAIGFVVMVCAIHFGKAL